MMVVAVKRKAAGRQTSDTTMERANQWFNNRVVVEQEVEIKQQGVSADYEHASAYQDDNDNDNSLKESSNPTSATNGPAVYNVADKIDKWQTNEAYSGCTVTYIDQYAMKEMGEMTTSEEGVTVSGGGEKEEQYDDIVGLN